MCFQKQQTERMGEKWTNLALQLDKAQSVEGIQVCELYFKLLDLMYTFQGLQSSLM